MFFKGSRYERVLDDRMTDASGREVRFKRVRFVTPRKSLAKHQVSQGERLDHIAFRSYRNSELFWVIADANIVMQAGECVDTPGEVIGIPASEI